MTKEEIQAEAEKYAEKFTYITESESWFQQKVNSFTAGVLSDTARKHWEQKWIPLTPETMPTEAKMYNVISSESYLPFVDFFKLDLEVFDFDQRNKGTSKRITHFLDLTLTAPPFTRLQ